MARIALIDDDYAAEVLVENLGFRGHDARRFRSASEALDSLNEIASTDLVVLDLIMEQPDGAVGVQVSGNRTTGMQILKAIRQKNQKIPVIVLSAINDPDVVAAVASIPNTQFLQKWSSGSLRDLVESLERAIGGHVTDSGPKAFIVHGHDQVEMLALKNFLQNVLHWPEPVILHEQPSVGRTIIEKFENYAKRVDLAFVLLTPDDKIASGDENNDSKRRARQNVIFEMGYFLGAFGRASGRIFLLHKGPLDLPSDISGVVYIDISGGVLAAGEQIRKELSHVV